MNPDTGNAYMIPPGMHTGTDIPIPAQWDECAKALIAIGTPLWHPSHPFDELRKWAITHLSSEGKATMDAYMASRTAPLEGVHPPHPIKKSCRPRLSKEAKRLLKTKRKAAKRARKQNRK